MLPATPEPTVIPETPEWPPAGWLTKTTTAARLDLSESRVAAMGGKEIQVKVDRNPSTKQVNTLFHEGDVERILWQRKHPEVHKALTKPNYPAPQAALPAPEPEDEPEADDGEPPPSPWPWLTLDQAAKYSKLTKRWLLAFAESPVEGMSGIRVRDMGKHAPGGRWRFHRESLEKA